MNSNLKTDTCEIENIKDSGWKFYRNSKGGITASGGEPTLQADFLITFLKNCKSRGLHTVLETHGFVDWEILKDISRYVDIVLFDIKHMDSKRHQRTIGLPNEIILSNLHRLLHECKKKIHIRIPVVPGFNDDLRNMKKTAQFIRSLNTEELLEQVQLLPYHGLGRTKYASLNMNYTLANLSPPSPERITQLMNVLEKEGVPIYLLNH